MTIRLAGLAWFGYRILSLQHLPHPLLIPALLLWFTALADHAAWCGLAVARRPRPAEAKRQWRVAAVTTYVDGVESLTLVANTLRALQAMDLAHDTWLLDESGDARVLALCAELGVRHFSRRGKPEYNTSRGKFEAGTKYGNYNSWLDAVGLRDYDIVASFDPDHLPDKLYLKTSLGYFEDPSIGYVQTPQAYYNAAESVVAGGAVEESYRYYSSVQMAAYASGFPIVTGCHTVHRTAALRSTGGFAAHAADDLLLTSNYQAAGWKGIYVPRIVARGLVPADWRSYLVQQERWARSVFDLKLHSGVYRDRRLSRAARWIGYLQGYRYLADAVVALSCLCLLSGVITGYGGPQTIRLAGILAAAGALVFVTNLYRQQFYLDPAGEAGIHWRAFVLRAAKWPYTCRALMDVVRKKRFAYAVTPKGLAGRRLLLLPHAAIAALVLSIWVLRGAPGSAGAAPAVFAVGGAVFSIALAVAPLLARHHRVCAPAAATARSTAARTAATRSLRPGRVAAWALACFFLLWSMRGAGTSSPANNDSARHAMNGAFILDLLRSGNVTHPISYAKSYHAHLPALSMPYHPPLFPCIEALVFALFGVGTFQARFAVALFTAVSVVLFYELVLRTHASDRMALASAAIFFSYGMSQTLASDVMLEMPALAFVLAAMLVLARAGEEFPLGLGVLYGLLAAAGIWTKQTVFLGPALFLYALLSGRRRWFVSAPLWIASGMILVASAGLFWLMHAAGWSSLPLQWGTHPAGEVLAANLRFYLVRLAWVWPAFVLATGAIVGALRVPTWRRYFQARLSLCVAWLAADAIVVLATPVRDVRYIYFALPAAVVLGFDLLTRIAGWARRVPFSGALPAALAAVVSIAALATRPPSYLSGPRQAAVLVQQMGYSRILYCGPAGGSFIFELRAASGGPSASVVRCDKLPAGSLRPDRLQDFAQRHGMRAIVVERGDAPDAAFLRDAAAVHPSAAIVLQGQWRLAGSEWNGKLLLYRVVAPSPRPEPLPPIEILSFGKTINQI